MDKPQFNALQHSMVMDDYASDETTPEGGSFSTLRIQEHFPKDMDVDDVILSIENPEKTVLHRNRNADRSLKLDDVIYRIHKQLFEQIPALKKLIKDGDRTLLKLDCLKREQVHFTPCGLDMVLDWIYGKRIEFTPLQLTDALAAAFALEVYDMVDAIEETVLRVSENPFPLVVLLYHVDNFSPETRKHLLTRAGAKIKELSCESPYSACPFHIFKRVIRAAIKEIGSSLNAIDVVQAILIWNSESTNDEMTTSLLDMIPTNVLQTHDINDLFDMIKEYGLEHLTAVILGRHYHESVTIDENRIAAGKNAVETSKMQDEAQVLLEHTAVTATPEDRHVVRKVSNSMKRVNFGTVELEKHNDLKIEITYKGEKEAAKNQPIKLYLDMEIDPSNVK